MLLTLLKIKLNLTNPIYVFLIRLAMFHWYSDVQINIKKVLRKDCAIIFHFKEDNHLKSWKGLLE